MKKAIVGGYVLESWRANKTAKNKAGKYDKRIFNNLLTKDYQILMQQMLY